MVNRSWGNLFGNREQSWQNAQFLPDQVGPTQFSSPRVMPTNQFVQRRISNQIVPHVQPSHLTTINQHNIHHQYHFPHTQSEINQCCETHTMCGHPFNPCKRNHW